MTGSRVSYHVPWFRTDDSEKNKKIKKKIKKKKGKGKTRLGAARVGCVRSVEKVKKAQCFSETSIVRVVGLSIFRRPGASGE